MTRTLMASLLALSLAGPALAQEKPAEPPVDGFPIELLEPVASSVFGPCLIFPVVYYVFNEPLNELIEQIDGEPTLSFHDQKRKSDIPDGVCWWDKERATPRK